MLITNILPTTNNEVSHEQQIVYFNPPDNHQTTNNPQSYFYSYHVPNSQIVNQFSSNNLAAHHDQQQHSSCWINMTTTDIQQQPPMHSNMNQQKIALLAYQPSVNVMAPSLSSSMINLTGSSTPISATTKRDRNDTSGVSESNAQLRPQYSQPIRVFSSSNMPNKRPRIVNQQRNEVLATNQAGQNIPMQHQQNVTK